MWDSLLNSLDDNAHANIAIQHWHGEAHSLKKISQGVNSVYRFSAHDEYFYLRLTHPQLRPIDELNAAIAFQAHLYRQNVPVCEPILSKNKQWVEYVEYKNTHSLVHVCREVPGKEIIFSKKNPELYKHWGQALGKFHHASLMFSTKRNTYTSWEKSFAELNGYIRNEPLAMQQLLQEVSNYFNDRPKPTGTFGLTHGDHREANVIAIGHHIHFIDFDLPSNHWFSEDFYRPFFHSAIHDLHEWQPCFSAYYQGYINTMPTMENMLNTESFLRHLQLKGLEIYLWTKNNWHGENAPGGNNTEKWLKKIYEKLINPGLLNSQLN